MRWLFFATGGLLLVVGVVGLAMGLLSDRKRREYAALGSRPVDSLGLIGVGLLKLFHVRRNRREDRDWRKRRGFL